MPQTYAYDDPSMSKVLEARHQIKATDMVQVLQLPGCPKMIVMKAPRKVKTSDCKKMIGSDWKRVWKKKYGPTEFRVFERDEDVMTIAEVEDWHGNVLVAMEFDLRTHASMIETIIKFTNKHYIADDQIEVCYSPDGIVFLGMPDGGGYSFDDAKKITEAELREYAKDIDEIWIKEEHCLTQLPFVKKVLYGDEFIPDWYMGFFCINQIDGGDDIYDRIEEMSEEC